MSFFDLFKINNHPKESMAVYERLANNEICNFYLDKIPKYCDVNKILWIEADVISDNIVKSFRINFYHERLGENIDTKISFRRYGHNGMEMSDFRDFMRFLSVALAKNKFVFLDRGFDDCLAGCVYDKKYARKVFLL